MSERKELHEQHAEALQSIQDLKVYVSLRFREPKNLLADLDDLAREVTIDFMQKVHLSELLAKLQQIIDSYCPVTGNDRQLEYGKSDGRIPQWAMDDLCALSTKFSERSQ